MNGEPCTPLADGAADLAGDSSPAFSSLDEKREVLITAMAELIASPEWGVEIRHQANLMMSLLNALRPNWYAEDLERERGLR